MSRLRRSGLLKCNLPIDRNRIVSLRAGRPWRRPVRQQALSCSRSHTPFACIIHPIGACAIGIFGGGAAADLRLAARCSTAILTIAQGTLPLGMFGPENCAYRRGLIGAPSRICQALAPLAFGLLIEPTAKWGVVASACLSLAALVALIALRQTKETQTIARAAT